MTLVDRIIAA